MRMVLRAIWLSVVVTANPHVSAQDPAETQVRLLYSPKNQVASDLQATLEKHFDGIPTTKFTVDKPANLLSIRARSKADLDEVLQALAAIDKLPRSIAFQALLIETAKPAEGAAPIELDVDQLTAAPDVVLKVVRGWVREGKVARARIFRWTALENQVAEQASTELSPKVSGVSIGITGKPTPVYHETNTGVIFSVKPRITDKNDILCELIHNNSQLEQGAVPVKADGSLEPGGVRQARTQTTLNIPSGRSVAVATREGEKPPQPQGEFLVLSATVVDPHAPPPSPPPTTPPPARGFAGSTPPTTERGSFGGSFASSSTSSLLLSQFRSEEFAKTIKLSDEQKKKLEAMSVERDKLTEQMSAAFRDPESAAAVSTKRRELYERSVEVLTAEQKAAFEKFADDYRRISRDRLRDAAGVAPSFADAVARASSPNLDRLTFINRAIERSPNQPRYLLTRAQIYAADEKWDESIADYRKVLELDPRDLAALTDLAAILVLRGDEAGFRKFAEQLIERFGNEASPAEKLRVADACLLRPEWLTNAAAPEAMLQAAIEGLSATEGPAADPPQPRARVNFGPDEFGGAARIPAQSAASISELILVSKARLHVLRGQSDQAIKLLTPFLDQAKAGAIRQHPDVQISAWCSMAIAQLSKGSPDAAASSLAQARALQTPTGRANTVINGPYSTFELTSKVRLQRAEEILRESGAKPAAAK